MKIIPAPREEPVKPVRPAGPVDPTDPQDFPITEIWAAPGGVVFFTVIGGLKEHMRVAPNDPWEDRTFWTWHIPADSVRIWAQDEEDES